MKKLAALFVCVFILAGALLPRTSAEDYPGMILIHESVEYVDEDTYFVERIYVPEVATHANTTSGTKSVKCVSGGTSIFLLTVTGQFTYDGSTAKATSAKGTISTYVPSATVTSRNAYTSGASAVASVSVSYSGATFSRIARLTCSADGVLS